MNKTFTGTISSSVGELQFEGGKLVKISGARPEYMSGDLLIQMVRRLASNLLEVKRETDLGSGGTP